jgi:hypothetical protein
MHQGITDRREWGYNKISLTFNPSRLKTTHLFLVDVIPAARCRVPAWKSEKKEGCREDSTKVLRNEVGSLISYSASQIEFRIV